MRAFKKTIAAAVAALIAVIPTAACGNDTPTSDDGYAKHAPADTEVVKKGVGVSRYNSGSEQGGKGNTSTTLAESAERIKNLGVGWYYNWGASPNNPEMDENIEFVPMVWGRGQSDADTLAAIKSKYDDGTYTHLLTFNEPDLPDQANMTVDQALSYWDDLESIGIPLSSPAVSSYSAENGHKWLDEFMEKAEAQDKRVDFIAIHIYQSFYSAAAVSELKTTMTALWNKYKRPIWLTEFAAVDIVSRDMQHPAQGEKGTVSPSCTVKNAQKYMTQATAMLEQLGFIERYAWFVDNFGGLYDNYTDDDKYNDRPWEAPYTTLYDNDDAISEVGKTYRDVTSVVALQLDASALPDAMRGAKYSQKLSVAGGTGDYAFSATGVPGGLKLSKDGTLSGKPTASGTFGIRVTVSDSGSSGRKQSATYTVSLTVSL